MNRIASHAARALTLAPLVGLLFAGLLWGGTEVDLFPGHSMAQTMAASNALDPEINAMIHEQAEALGCSSTIPTLGEVAVRNAKGFDRGVVRIVSFDVAYASSSKGDVWVVGYCAS